jgi:carbamoyltransferase
MSSASTCLGLHVGHDRAISIVQGGQLTFHIAVERLDRRKYSDSPNLPVAAIREVLNRLAIPVAALEATCVSYHGVEAGKISSTLEADFKAAFPEFKGRFSALDHHLAHALAAFSCSPFDEAVVFVADGAGDVRLWGSQSESVFHVSRKHFYPLVERVQDRPLSLVDRPEFFDPNFFTPDDRKRQISLGLKYEQLTYLCGFAPGQAGQTMALAAYGTPLFDIAPLVPRDFGFSLRYIDLLDRMDELAREKGLTLRQFASQHKADVAATAQTYIQRSLTSLVDYIVRTYNPTNLCFAGGVFLNCLTNRDIIDKYRSRGLFILPACHDEGQSLGAAAYAYWQLTATLPSVGADFPYLGFQYSQEDCDAAMSQAGMDFERQDDHVLARRLAELIASGRICAVLRGRSETGPRALGHRSILADPRSRRSKSQLDRAIKRRARFRPYAPMVLLSRMQDYFDANDQSPYMLLSAQVKPEHRAQLQAVTHVDGSARPQTVSPDDDAFLCDLLMQFEEQAGVPVLLNTSFNDETEPIVESPQDAIRIFHSTELDALVLGSSLHVKPRS